MPRTSHPPLYLALADNVERLIASGTLRPGDRVPSVRRMSRQHKVSPPTVVQAYLALENRGIIEARPRSGFYVRAQPIDPLKLPTFSNRKPLARSLAKFPPLMAMVSDLGNPELVPLGGANPSGDLLPARKLARISATVSRLNPKAVINYDPAPGCARLREELSRRSLEWGCYLQSDQFLITNGATEALHLALHAVARPGDTVLVESPTYYGLLSLLSFLHLNVIAIPSHAQTGIDLDAVESALELQRVAAMIVVPNFSNPLGSLMPEENRRRLIALAAGRGVPIIEDDIYGDLSHEGDRPRAMKALDADGSVILCGSFSKTLAPGYRIGYLAAGPYQDQLAQAKMALNFGGAPLPALTVAEFLRNGGYGHHLRTLRHTFRDQVSRMREAIAAAFPGEVKISAPLGGFVLWVELPRGVDALRLFYLARDAGISIAPGHLFAPSAEFKNFIRISCGHPWSPRIEAAVSTLGKLLERSRK
jgi:DNA-binding transcriptional MocR family regulator